jgi:outer membrane murein-binding lipoprotein Lpp
VDKNGLEQLLSSYNWWMGLSTIAVALGILGEYVAHFIFEEDARRNKWEMAISILFGALVLGGVVGEYIFGKRLTQVSEQLQQIADEAVAQSNKDAAQARRDAETAKDDAAKADEKAGKANERASKNEREAAQLRKDAETEHLARVQIEAAVAWRHPDEQEKHEIGAALASFGPKAGASMWFNGSSTEAEMFADDIAEALRLGHIATTAPGGLMEMRESGKWNGEIKSANTGLVIQSTKAPAAIEFAEALIKELTSRGFDAKRQTDPPFDDKPEPIIWATVQSRPRGPQG